MDDLSSIQTGEQILQIPIDQIHPFEGHPFKVLADDLMQQTVESVSRYGVLNPIIIRPDPDGGYEMISGHRRFMASELAGKRKIPAIVRDMTDDEAIILIVDSNLQREGLLPSERAFAYKMKLEAIKHQGRQVGTQESGMRTDALIAKDVGISRNQFQRYIRLTALVPELLDRVDNGAVGFNPAVELSFLKRDEQRAFLEVMDYTQTPPTLSQAQQLKKHSQEGSCTKEVMLSIMSQEKKIAIKDVMLDGDVIRKFFPKSFTQQEIQNTIVGLLEQWKRHKNRDKSR